MGKKYNQFTTNDLPMEDSFKPSVSSKSKSSKSKSQLTRIGGSKTVDKKKTSSKTNNSSKKKTTTSKVDINELGRINSERISNYSFRAKRNRVLIVILVMLLLMVIAGVSIFYFVNKEISNCFVTITGDSGSVCYVNNKKLIEFKTPAGIQGNRTYVIDVDIETSYEGAYMLEFEVLCYQNGQIMKNVELEYNLLKFEKQTSGRYLYKDVLNGAQRIDAFTRVYIDREYETSLNSANFEMRINFYIIKI